VRNGGSGSVPRSQTSNLNLTVVKGVTIKKEEDIEEPKKINK
jgi:hypothetical protein